MMKMIKHKNIVKLIEVLASNSKIYLVLELIKGGDLFDVIKGKFFCYFKLSIQRKMVWMRKLQKSISFKSYEVSIIAIKEAYLIEI